MRNVFLATGPRLRIWFLLGAAVLLNSPALLAQGSPLPTITAVSPATNAPLAGANDVITITVSPANPGGSTPTGTVAVTVDTASANSSIPLANGAASYTFSASSGSHVITAYYSGDQTYASSVGTVTVSIVHKTFVISATSPTVTAGSAAVSTVTITPLNGYTGTVTFTVGSNSQTQVPCFSAPDTVISGTTPVTASLTMQTKASACPKVGRLTLQDGVIAAATSLLPANRGDDSKLPPASAALAVGVFAALGLFVRKRRIMFALPLLALVALAGCGSSSGSSNVPVGTYSVIISAVDKSANVAATTTIILTVQ
jgi:hypothetical protein